MATEYDNMSSDDSSKFCQESSTKTPLELISFLQHFELLHRFRVCICRTQMVLVQRPDVPDRFTFYNRPNQLIMKLYQKEEDDHLVQLIKSATKESSVNCGQEKNKYTKIFFIIYYNPNYNYYYNYY